MNLLFYMSSVYECVRFQLHRPLQATRDKAASLTLKCNVNCVHCVQFRAVLVPRRPHLDRLARRGHGSQTDSK